MFRFAYAKMNNGMYAAAACAEAASSCSADTMDKAAVMDAAPAASILICVSILRLRVLALVLLGIILISHFVLGQKS